MAKAKSFEQSMDELDEIVRALENGDTALDESLKLFEQGVKLSKSCQDMLEKATQKVTILLQNEDGDLQEKNFTQDNV